MEILIISGLSGAGKSSAATYLEDMGYYTVDNVPADIILKFAEFCAQSDGRYDRVALVSDIRSGNGNFQGILDAMERLKQGGDICRLLFVTADLETIIKRYKETRRRHPLMSDGMTIEQAMHREQELLRPLREHADFVIDTTLMPAAKLRNELYGLFGRQERAWQAERERRLIRLQIRHPAGSRPGIRRALPAQSLLRAGAQAQDWHGQ